jgi:hypothetical protein
MTRLRKMMLEELQRRNFSEDTIQSRGRERAGRWNLAQSSAQKK